MFEPITSQEQLDEVTSSRIRRERAKLQRKYSEALQPYIDSLARMHAELMDLQKDWKQPKDTDK